MERSEYLAKKESLLNRRYALEGLLAKLETGSSAWLEPCQQFLAAAHSAGQLAVSGDKVAQRDFLKEIGSNHSGQQEPGELPSFAWQEGLGKGPKPLKSGADRSLYSSSLTYCIHRKT